MKYNLEMGKSNMLCIQIIIITGIRENRKPQVVQVRIEMLGRETIIFTGQTLRIKTLQTGSGQGEKKPHVVQGEFKNKC